jgi:hypothetical protein
MRQLPEPLAGGDNPQRGNGAGIMSFGTDSATHAGGSPAAAPGLIVQHGRRGWRGKNADQEPLGGAAQSGVMVKTAPTTTFVMA